MAKNVGEQYNSVIPVSIRSRDTRRIAGVGKTFPNPYGEGNYQGSTTSRVTEVEAVRRLGIGKRVLDAEMRYIQRLYIQAKDQRIYGAAADSWVAKKLGVTLPDLASIVVRMEIILKNSWRW